MWLSPVLPRSVHDSKAAWIWQIMTELVVGGWIVLADKATKASREFSPRTKGGTSPPRRSRPTALTPGYAAVESGRSPSSKYGGSCGSCAAVQIRPRGS